MGSAAVQGRLWGMRARDHAAGLLALLASRRGAQVTTRDASAPLLALARARLPGADVREGDREALPFADAAVAAVTTVNSSVYAAAMAAAARKLARVARPGGRVVVIAWGPPERCAFLAAVLPAPGAADAAPAARRPTRRAGRPGGAGCAGGRPARRGSARGEGG
jgi:SAM-dependent methyltransferase